MPASKYCVMLALICPLCSGAGFQSTSEVPETAKADGARFLGRSSSSKAAEVQEVSPVVLRSLGAVFGGFGEEVSSRLGMVEASLMPAFEAQTTKVNGRLKPLAARAVAYSFFAQEHGWLVKGLEPPYELQHDQGLHEVPVLRKAPAVVEALIEVQRQRQGLSLGDLAAAVTAIERLLLGESVGLLEAAYELNGQDVMDWLSKDTLHDVLQSYLLIFRQGSRANLLNATKHEELKARARRSGRSWQELVAFESESVNQFSALGEQSEGSRQFSFEDVVRIARDMALRYGKWQDSECKAMTSELQGLDTQRLGSIPIHTFHQQPRNPVYGYKFTESLDYLRATGVLMEKAGQAPQVLIANYVMGPSNCIASSQFLSVCCVNKCESLADDIWRKLRSPAVEPMMLANIVGNLSTALPGAAQWDTTKLKGELHDIAERQHGKVALSSPAFRQWLHQAFPGHCPLLPPSAQAPGVATVPDRASFVPTVPPSHRPNVDDCTRMPEYFFQAIEV